MYLGAMGITRGGGSVSANTGVTGVSSDLIGPFTEREGCPKGSVVAHRYGGNSFQNPERMVQCRVVQTAPAPTSAPSASGQQAINFTPTITVSPNVQTEVSPQISPVFQQTGQGSQSAGTTQVSPGGQSATGGGSNDSSALIEFLKQQQQAEERRRIEEQQRQQAAVEAQKEQLRIEAEARQKEQAAQRLLDEQRYYEAEQARIRAEDQREAERQRLYEEQQAQVQTREQERVAELQRIQDEMANNAAQFQASIVPAGGGGGGGIDWGQPLLPAETAVTNTEVKTQLAKPASIMDNLPLLIGGGLVLVGGAYYYSKSKGRKRRA